MTKRSRSSPYPQYPLERCEQLAQRVMELGPYNVHQDILAQKTGYKNSKVGPFLGLRAAAKYFGLIEYTGEYVSLTPWAVDSIHSRDPQKLQLMRYQAVQRPDLFQKLLAEYSGKQVPDVVRLVEHLRIHYEKYGILREATETAAQVFLESVKYAGLIDDRGFLIDPSDLRTSNVANVPARTDKKENEDTAGSIGMRGLMHSLRSHTELDEYHVTLSSGQKILLALPTKLAKRDKERLIRYIELIPDAEDDVTGQ